MSGQLNQFRESEALDTYCKKWDLSEPAILASTFTSEVYRVKFNGHRAVLKIFNEKGIKFESRGAIVLRCFDGKGAVRLLNADSDAHLLEHADGKPLKELVARGSDDEATAVISEVLNKLHSYAGPIPEGLISMERNFRSLFQKIKTAPSDSIYAVGAHLAQRLVETEQEVRVLHGDIHHENILESSDRGWVAIDPQCLVGERTYDIANAFYNPNGFLNMVESTDTIERRCAIYSKQMNLDRQRILEYAFAYGCLSACWCLEDGQSAENTLRIARSIQSILKINCKSLNPI